ncbi:MAG: monovalent cation/H(+) antiporter subunit G [Coriobacteriia bacterium]|nr:monovalent cation/H(+) antiporter subunit G [Coriobacteriia bacterium]
MSTLDAILRAITVVLSGIGMFFFFVGTFGLLRLPDFYSRTHAATKCDTVGAGALLLALVVHNGLDVSGLKILALAVLVLLSSPTAANALARAAYKTGLVPWRHPEREVSA